MVMVPALPSASLPPPYTSPIFMVLAVALFSIPNVMVPPILPLLFEPPNTLVMVPPLIVTPTLPETLAAFWGSEFLSP